MDDSTTDLAETASIIESRPSSFTLSRDILIEGVIYFDQQSNRSKGNCGQLILNSLKLSFTKYSPDHKLNVTSKSTSNIESLSPFLNVEVPDSLQNDIYNLNLGEVKDSLIQEGQSILLIIYCLDFRCFEFQLRNNETSKRLIEKLKFIAANSFINGKQSKLCNFLKCKYSFNLKADWDTYEGHWWQYYKLRLTQCNEDFQLCDSLPTSFIVPKNLKDAVLLSSISTSVKGQRVPIVTYLHRESTNLLIRSALFDYYPDINHLLRNQIHPLRQLNTTEILPPLSILENAFNRLRDGCYQYSDANNFMSRIGKWMFYISRTLKFVTQISYIIQKEASVCIVEDEDKSWNCLLSCLVQLILDPRRRTFTGFESLVSKEWIYLSGIATRSQPRNPNHVLFTLFLDCVWQLIAKNPTSFEFSSFYLIWLFDNQFTVSPNALINVDRRASTTPSLTMKIAQPIPVEPLEAGMPLCHSLLLYNPFFKVSQSALVVRSHICEVQLFSTLYFRWQHTTNHDCYTIEELLYLNNLRNRQF